MTYPSLNLVQYLRLQTRGRLLMHSLIPSLSSTLGLGLRLIEHPVSSILSVRHLIAHRKAAKDISLILASLDSQMEAHT